jgi:predicted porin
MMKKVFVPLLCFLFLLFSLSFAEDKGRGVEVRSTSPEILEIQPGKIVTGSFLVSNHTQQEEELFEKLTLPAGWQEIVAEQFTLKLKAEEQHVRVVAFLVPLTSPAGRYHIRYSISSQRDYSISDSDSLSVVVLPVIKLEILVEDKPEMVIAGQTYQVRLRPVNKGNNKTDLKLKLKSNLDYPVKMDPSQIALEAGESQIIIVEVRTEEELKQRIKHTLEIEAMAEESGNGGASVRQTVSVEIIPKVTGEFDPYHKLPVQVALIGAGQDGESGFQVELSGSGGLDEEGTQRVDFLFRGPDIQERSRRGKRDEYRISYHHEYLSLHFGDRSYSLSPLTDRLSYGRGVEANVHHGSFRLGAFRLKSRWGKPEARKVGTYLAYRFSDKFGIKGNFLTKNKEATSSFAGYDDRIYSIQAEIKPDEKLELDLEFGFGESDREDRFSDLAFRIDLGGRIFKQIRYSFEKTHAEPKYFGYYNDADYTSGTISFPVYGKLRGNVGYRAYQSNLDIDSTKGAANREESYQSSISYSFPFGTHVSLGYKDLTREDYVLPADYDYQEKTWKLGLTQTLGKFCLSTHIERGRFEDRLLDTENDNLERYSLYASFRPSYRQSLSLYARTGHNSFTASSERTRSVGFSTSWHIKDNLSLGLNYRRDESGSEGGQQRNDIFSSLNYTLPNKHAITLRYQWSLYEQREKEEYSFFAMYSIPLRIPVVTKKSTGVLKGTVYDDEVPTRPPIPGVILTVLGATAITNQNGEFIFPSLKPGIYYLRAERSSIGLNRIPNEKIPIMIEVKGGETVEIEVGVVASCGISGRVAVFALESDKGFGEADTSTIFDSTASPPGMERISYPELKQPARSRELLKTKEPISVSPDVAFEMRCFKGSEKIVYFSGKEVFLRASPEGIILFEGETGKFEEKIERVVFIPKNKRFCFSLNGKDYKGILEVIFAAKGSSLSASCWLWVGDNLEEEVTFETGNQRISEFEAPKARAVTASSESLFLIGPGEEERLKKDDLRNGKGLGNVLVEITDGKEVLRQHTDQKGRFYFEEIKPGIWILKVCDQDLPAYHYLEEEQFEFDLRPGEEKDVIARVLPRLRPIQIIEEGEID